jgi:hypothetical protein
MSIFGDFFKKEAPLLGMQGSGGGLGFLAGRGGPKVSATGGTKTTVGAYTIHTFSYPTTDNFVVDKGGEVDILVVAGGGGGGGGGPAQWQGGGGGAGGYAYVTEYTVVPGTTYPIAVGNGGNGGSPGTRGTGGGNSSFYPSGPTTSSIFCQGGGGGGAGKHIWQCSWKSWWFGWRFWGTFNKRNYSWWICCSTCTKSWIFKWDFCSIWISWWC